MTANSERSDDALDLVRRLDPIRRARLDGSEVQFVLEALARDVVARPRSRHSFVLRRLKLASAAALVAAIVGVGVAAAAGAFHARTGTYPSGPNSHVGGPGEELDPSAPDVRSVALNISSDIPYPAAYASWRDLVISREIQHAGGGLETTGALRGWFAGSAFCAWVDDWRHATAAGDSTEATQAATEIGAAPTWAAVTAEDPHPSASRPNDPGAETGTLFGWMLPYRDAVMSGDSARVAHLLATNYGDGKCRLADPKDQP